jgi:hypothetical protein
MKVADTESNQNLANLQHHQKEEVTRQPVALAKEKYCLSVERPCPVHR